MFQDVSENVSELRRLARRGVSRDLYAAGLCEAARAIEVETIEYTRGVVLRESNGMPVEKVANVARSEAFALLAELERAEDPEGAERRERAERRDRGVSALLAIVALWHVAWFEAEVAYYGHHEDGALQRMFKVRHAHEALITCAAELKGGDGSKPVEVYLSRMAERNHEREWIGRVAADAAARLSGVGADLPLPDPFAAATMPAPPPEHEDAAPPAVSSVAAQAYERHEGG